DAHAVRRGLDGFRRGGGGLAGGGARDGADDGGGGLAQWGGLAAVPSYGKEVPAARCAMLVQLAFTCLARFPEDHVGQRPGALLVETPAGRVGFEIRHPDNALRGDKRFAG